MDRTQLIDMLEVVYRERYRQFLRMAIAIVGDEVAADDVVQETFARAIRAGHTYRADGSVEAWVWSVLLNTARAARSRTGEALDSPMPFIVGDGQPDVGDDDGVRAWVAALPERQRLAVFLRYYADLDYRSIASALGVEVGTVSATLSAAHTALRRMLKEVSP